MNWRYWLSGFFLILLVVLGARIRIAFLDAPRYEQAWSARACADIAAPQALNEGAGLAIQEALDAFAEPTAHEHERLPFLGEGAPLWEEWTPYVHKLIPQYLEKNAALFDCLDRLPHEPTQVLDVACFDREAHEAETVKRPGCETLGALLELAVLHAIAEKNAPKLYGALDLSWRFIHHFSATKDFQNQFFINQILQWYLSAVEQAVALQAPSTAFARRLLRQAQQAQHPGLLVEMLEKERRLQLRRETGAQQESLLSASFGYQYREHMVAHFFFQQAIDTAQETSSKPLLRQAPLQFSWSGGWLPGYSDLGLTVQSLQQMRRIVFRQWACYALLQGLAALELYRQKHGAYPETLKDLDTLWKGEAPVDPYDKQALRYRQDPEQVLLYVIGENRQDDGGPALQTGVGDDWGLTIPRVLSPSDALINPQP